jgi:hypothetical protein
MPGRGRDCLAKHKREVTKACKKVFEAHRNEILTSA